MPESCRGLGESRKIVSVEMVVLQSPQYDPGMFRKLADLLPQRLPKMDSPRSWQLSDDLESSLMLALFPVIHTDRELYGIAEKTFREVTGAEPYVWLQTWHLPRFWVEGHVRPYDDPPRAS